jgi:hypothetical protein
LGRKEIEMPFAPIDQKRQLTASDIPGPDSQLPTHEPPLAGAIRGPETCLAASTDFSPKAEILKPTPERT